MGAQETASDLYTFQLYNSKDKNALLEIFQSNIPKYFDPSEIGDYTHYLENEVEDYYTIIMDGKIVGAGGINLFPELRETRITWDIVHKSYQGRGLGKALTEFRIKRIKEEYEEVDFIRVRTSQFVFEFYEKLGFKLKRINQEFWAKGFDLYELELVI